MPCNNAQSAVPWKCMSEQSSKLPYKSLGARLKRMREKLQESLAEVSGAVEIDIEALTAIEIGRTCPSEDILLLLISHFGVKEDEATKLWELAGYDQQQIPFVHMINEENGGAKPSVLVMPADASINYTDMVHVMVNNYGVVMNFMQGAGPNNQPLIVARLGMSKEHAKSVLEVLQKTLEQDIQKSLPAPDAKKPGQRQQKSDK
jgi:transcriptional regulator with XRE-family HTH domain